MDLFLEGEVTKTWLRIKDIRPEIWDGIGSSATARGHRHDLRKLASGFSFPDIVLDEMPEVKKWTCRYQVHPDFTSGVPRPSPISCFTDGAKLQNSNTGAGYCICSPHLILRTDSFPMGPDPSVHQAELTAILRAAEGLLPYAKRGDIIIHSDSQAAIRSLDSPVITSKLVLTTAYALDVLAMTTNYTVTLAWIKAHAGHAGNDKADSLAKQGAAMHPADLDQVVPLPRTHFNHLVNDEIVRRWNTRWTRTTTARQSRLLWPRIDKSRSKQILLCDRSEYSDLVRMLTGHNNLNRHRFLLKESDTADCRLCNEDEEESSEHVLLHCPALSGVRRRILGHHTITEASVFGDLPPNGIRRFITLTRRALLDGGLEQI
jgi:ribonuclease HI